MDKGAAKAEGGTPAPRGVPSANLQSRVALAKPTWPSWGYKDVTCQFSCRSAQNCGRAQGKKRHTLCPGKV